METFLKIENIKLWSRVGVLDEERELGQQFILDIFLWTDFEKCTVNDDIKKTIDYSRLVQILKDQSKKIYCFTIEKYSNEILEIIDQEFKLSKIKIIDPSEALIKKLNESFPIPKTDRYESLSFENIKFFVTSEKDVFSKKVKFWFEINKEISLVNLGSNV